MEPIIAQVGDAGVSSRDTDNVPGLLKTQRKQRGKGKAGSGFAGIEPADRSSFFLMLQQNMPAASGIPSGGGSAMSTGKALKGQALGSEKPGRMAAGAGEQADGKEGPAPVRGGIDLLALLKGLGLTDGQANRLREEIGREIEHTLGQSSAPSGERAGKRNGERVGEGVGEPAGKEALQERVVALLRGQNVAEGQIQQVLAGLENGIALSSSFRQNVLRPTGELPGTERRDGGMGGALFGNLPGDGAVPERMKVFAVGNNGLSEDKHGEGALIAAPGRERGIEPAERVSRVVTMKSAPAREGLTSKEQPGIPFSLPTATAAAAKGDDSEGRSVPSGNGVLPERASGERTRGPAKQRPAVFTEQVAEGDRGRQERDLFTVAGKAAGMGDSEPSWLDSSIMRARREEGTIRAISLTDPQQTTGGNADIRGVDQGNPGMSGGVIQATGPEQASGVRPEGVISQITESVGQLSSQSPSRMKITLNPPHLGTVDMDVLVRNNKVEVVIVASNQEVQQVLRVHADQLKQALQGQGLKMDGFDVLLSGNQEGPGYRFAGGNFAGDTSGGSGHREEAEPDSPLAGLLPPHDKETTGDGISVFA